MAATSGTAEHWDGSYAAGVSNRSWFQEQPSASLHMLGLTGITARDSVIDVGGGASVFVDALLERGHADVTVLDVSAGGLEAAQRRLGPAARHVDWLVTDLLVWQPRRVYAVWHDRAVFHFLHGDARHGYLRALSAATTAGSTVILGCFAPEGPSRCSGLPVARYSPVSLSQTIGPDWTLLAEAQEDHRTPGGVVQPFTWAALRRHR